MELRLCASRHYSWTFAHPEASLVLHAYILCCLADGLQKVLSFLLMGNLNLYLELKVRTRDLLEFFHLVQQSTSLRLPFTQPKVA